ncbi:MAG: DUF86 domain-containing protein [Thaumarchaeota archaeon]|jgi:uncharacterized protein YutE (UPF0331/DUF86 family)/predicted nucleotidyltransferase|nr:DUF86 domain-containing protein [Candidatus Geocrenenecus arthurdayi]
MIYVIVVLDGKEVIPKIVHLLPRFPEVVFLVLFGSLATKNSRGHDIDLAVKIEGSDKYETLARLVREISETLGVGEELIDIVDLDRADTMVKARVLQEGLVLVDKKNFKEKLHEELSQVNPDYWEYAVFSLREWLKLEDPTYIDVIVVKRRIDFIKSEIEFLEEYVLSKNVNDVKSSPILGRLLERGYQLIVEAIIDICRHLASVKGWRTAGVAKDYIMECVKHGVVDASLAEQLTHHIALRSIIIHRYLAIDYEKLYEEALKLTKHARDFERYLQEFISKESGYTILS